MPGNSLAKDLRGLRYLQKALSNEFLLGGDWDEFLDHSAFDPSNLEAPLFWLLPLVSLGVFLVTCYVVDRTVLKQRWSSVALLRRAWWRLVSFVIPLLMVASGFTLIFSGKIVGTAWLITAGMISRIGTAFLRRAEGMKFNRLKTGEIRNRALKMAARMGVTISRVYSCLVTQSFFPLLGMEPLMGRVFSEREAGSDSIRVAILSYATWQDHFGADPHIIGPQTEFDLARNAERVDTCSYPNAINTDRHV